MPLYEYRCLECEHVMEVLQKFSDRPLRRCEKCSGKLEKLISRSSFSLKGGGWYDQGYGNGNKTKTKTEGKGKKDSGGSGSSGTGGTGSSGSSSGGSSSSGSGGKGSSKAAGSGA